MLGRSKLGQHSSRWPAFPAVQEAATPSEPQRVRLLLPGLILHRSSPEETPPEPFYSAGPLAYAFHLLKLLAVNGAGGLDNPFAGTSAPRLVVGRWTSAIRLGRGGYVL